MAIDARDLITSQIELRIRCDRHLNHQIDALWSNLLDRSRGVLIAIVDHMVCASCGRESRLGRAGDRCENGGTSPARQLDRGVAHRTRASGNQDNLAGKGTRMQPLRSVL